MVALFGAAAFGDDAMSEAGVADGAAVAAVLAVFAARVCILGRPPLRCAAATFAFFCDAEKVGSSSSSSVRVIALMATARASETACCFVTAVCFRALVRVATGGGTAATGKASASSTAWAASPPSSAMSCPSGDVIASDLNSFFKLSGRLERPAYPEIIVMKMAMSCETLTCFPTNSITRLPFFLFSFCDLRAS